MENVLGLVEDVHIDGIGTMQAKTDTGNTGHNVIHGIVKSTKNSEVTFETVGGKTVTMPYEDEIKVHIGSGNKENRPVVKLNITINGKKYENVSFSIADRSENTYKILLGEEFIKANGGIVDATKED
jgi:hypothetical protein